MKRQAVIEDLFEHKNEKWHTDFSQFLIENADMADLIVERWQEKIRELELWISIASDFRNPKHCIAKMNSLGQDQWVRFNSFVQETEREVLDGSPLKSG